MSILLLIMLLSAVPFPVLAAIEIADQYRKRHHHSGCARRIVTSR
jgi:hypothetical protein